MEAFFDWGQALQFAGFDQARKTGLSVRKVAGVFESAQAMSRHRQPWGGSFIVTAFAPVVSAGRWCG
jgi:hypothetical protein